MVYMIDIFRRKWLNLQSSVFYQKLIYSISRMNYNLYLPFICGTHDVHNSAYHALLKEKSLLSRNNFKVFSMAYRLLLF